MNDHVMLSRIALFEVLAGELHFGRSAQLLGVSQSTVSEQLRLLENDLDVVLFERDTRNVRLTAHGERLVDPAKQLLAQAERFRTQARLAAERPGAVMRFGYPASATTSVMKSLMPILGALADTAIETHMCQVADMGSLLDNGDLDVALMFDVAAAARRDLGWVDFLTDEARIVVGPGHPLFDEASVSLATFTRMPAAVGPDLTGDRRAQLEARFAALGHPLDIVHTSHSLSDNVLHLLTGRNVGFGTALLAKVGTDAGLRSIPIVEPFPVQWGFAFVEPARDQVAEAIRRLVADAANIMESATST